MKQEERHALQEYIESLLDRVKNEPMIGRKILIGAGIMNQDGTFTENYKSLEILTSINQQKPKKLMKRKLKELKEDLEVFNEINATINTEVLRDLIDLSYKYVNEVLEVKKEQEEENYSLSDYNPDTFVYKYELEANTSKWIVDMIIKTLNLHIEYDIDFNHLPTPIINSDGSVTFTVYSNKKNVSNSCKYEHKITIKSRKYGKET